MTPHQTKVCKSLRELISATLLVSYCSPHHHCVPATRASAAQHAELTPGSLALALAVPSAGNAVPSEISMLTPSLPSTLGSNVILVDRPVLTIYEQ